ncbi:MAG: methyltransferase domain-containing protein [Nitrosomonadales bacterium]|nr:methyltransferase domain-containing protein [Nitrosomonadales bacterium]
MSQEKSIIPFSFSSHAENFDEHIEKSIRGYADLRNDCILLSEYFVENDTNVLDLGCSTGKFLREIRNHNQDKAPDARYLGVDIEAMFRKQWAAHATDNVYYHLCDLRSFDGYENLSFITSLFSLQFIPEKDRCSVMQKIFCNLIPGGAFVMAEKTLGKSPKIQDMLTFMYYDYKRQNFSEQEILEKERSLRNKLKLWSEPQIITSLEKAGFHKDCIQVFWRNHLFAGFLAIKQAN